MTGRRPRVALAALALVVGAVSSGCGQGGEGGSGGEGGAPGGARAASTATVPGLPAAQVDDAVEGLCQAREEAGGDVNPARTTFYDRSHDPLHAIAGALEPVDRPLAGRLLEAKQAVEADLASPARAASLTADLDRLLEVTREALARLSVPSPPCP